MARQIVKKASSVKCHEERIGCPDTEKDQYRPPPVCVQRGPLQAMDSRRPAVKIAAGAIILAALISLLCPSKISIKPIILLTAIALALVRFYMNVPLCT